MEMALLWLSCNRNLPPFYHLSEPNESVNFIQLVADRAKRFLHSFLIIDLDIYSVASEHSEIDD